MARHRKEPGLAVFVHAGAGYHSFHNADLHLRVCENATRAAMKALKAGRTAVEAVEAGIRVLEDDEIPNAGYGSNLTYDGIVEGDATIVDHMGRSGACGAVPGVRNPITLAREIYDCTLQPLSLGRVPPNFLVGEGARKFAYNHHITVVEDEAMISPAAQDRYLQWRDDLERHARQSTAPPEKAEYTSESGLLTPPRYRNRAYTPDTMQHRQAVLSETWNEGQPHSPASILPSPPHDDGGYSEKSFFSSPRSPPSNGLPTAPSNTPTDSGSVRNTPSPLRDQANLPKAADDEPKSPGFLSRLSSKLGRRTPVQETAPAPAAFTEVEQAKLTSPPRTYASVIKGNAGDSTTSPKPSSDLDPGNMKDHKPARDVDLITDTVGVICIDVFGNIAAGSSSGGIGMKHSGRIGPAAIANVGTAVVPVHQGDKDQTCVAVVTSGTGEHMTSTNASYKCAERLYHNCAINGIGALDDQAAEDEILDRFIRDEFMDHPGVKNQICPGAIGIMAVKMTKNKCYFHFAHNTHSFALASMSSNDRQPMVSISRTPKGQSVVRGARKISLA